MLTNEQKQLIRLEEVFRAEVKSQLAAERPKSRAAVVWGCLNANLVVWFLGSVVATSIVVFLNARDQRVASAQLEQKLDTEIAARVYRTRSYLRRLESTGTVLNVSDVLRATGPVDDQPYPMGVFSEYSQRTLESLLWELSTTTSERQRPPVLMAMHSSRTLRDIEAEITVAMARDAALKCKFILRVYAELDSSFGLDRWRISQSEPVVAAESQTEGCSA